MEGYYMLLARYGFKRDPFRPGAVVIETGDMRAVREVTALAVDADGMMNIIGEPGIGKSNAVERAISPYKVVKVEVDDKENLKIGAIRESLIRSLSQESPRRTIVARMMQLRRILGEVSSRQKIVLWLEEGHRIRKNTMRALKTLREMEFAGRKPLFSVIFCSQFNTLKCTDENKEMEEIRIRTDTHSMEGWSRKEARQYIDETVGDRFDKDAADALVRCAKKTPLGVREAAIICMQRALEHGRKQVEAIDVLEALGGGLKEAARSLGLSDGDLAKETGLSRSMISGVLNGNVPSSCKEDTEKDAKDLLMNVVKKRMVKDSYQLAVNG